MKKVVLLAAVAALVSVIGVQAAGPFTSVQNIATAGVTSVSLEGIALKAK